MSTKQYDVLIVGAGAAGMMAALEIALTGKSVAVIEAKNRTGGRMHTIINSSFEKPVELGAEFVHGDLPVTLELFKKAGIEKQEATGEVWEYKTGKLEMQDDFIDGFDALIKMFKSLDKDLSVAEFMKHHLAGSEHKKFRSSLKNYVEGYYAGDIKKASTYALCEEFTTGEEKDYRVDGGYSQLAAYLENECRHQGVNFYLGEEVQEVKWKSLEVEVVTDKQSFSGKKVVTTVSVGVLQSGSIRFSPALPHKEAAIQQLGFGHVVKVNLQFADVFWKDKSLTGEKDLSALNFLFSKEQIPTWWTQHPQKEALLVGWLGGPPASAFINAAKDVVIEKAITSLAQLFGINHHSLQQKLLGAEWYNWSGDNHFCGAYSYNVVNGEALINTILEPVDNTIYFSGEGLHYGDEIGTVEAALASGREVAHLLVAQFNAPAF